MERLRAMAAEYDDANEQRRLTKSELGLAHATSIMALEKAAVFAEAAGLGDAVGDVRELREAIAYELAHSGVRDEARSLARRANLAILRRKHKAAMTARALYSVGKSVSKLDSGDPLKTHVGDMKRALTRRRKAHAAGGGDGQEVTTQGAAAQAAAPIQPAARCENAVILSRADGEGPPADEATSHNSRSPVIPPRWSGAASARRPPAASFRAPNNRGRAILAKHGTVLLRPASDTTNHRANKHYGR